MSGLSVASPNLRPRAKISLHRVLVTLAIVAAVATTIAIAVYGLDYYWLDLSERPFSPKHALLKPSGRIGLSFGILGFSLFLIIFLYPLRKRIRWLAVRGSARHWLDFHVVAGCFAPIVIMFHASFKFQGIAGLAFWFMLAVALSGIAGRYVYAQIPPTLNSAEHSLKQLEEVHAPLSDDILARSHSQELVSLLRMPTAEEIKRMSDVAALLSMIRLDFIRPFRIAQLRASVAGRNRITGPFLGFFPSSNRELEAAISSVRKRSTLAKRVAFLTKTQRIFHLWHVVHRPFSYSFAVLAVIHLVVVFLLGYI